MPQGRKSLLLSFNLALICLVVSSCVNGIEIRDIDLQNSELSRLRAAPTIQVVYDSPPDAFTSITNNRDLATIRDIVVGTYPFDYVKDHVLEGLRARLTPATLVVQSDSLRQEALDSTSDDNRRLLLGFRPTIVLKPMGWWMERKRVPHGPLFLTSHWQGKISFSMRVTIVWPEENQIVWQHTCHVTCNQVILKEIGTVDLNDDRQYGKLDKLEKELLYAPRILEPVGIQMADDCAKDLMASFPEAEH